MSALLTAVRNTIRTAIGPGRDDQCDIHVDGVPPSFPGLWYYAVWEDGFRQESTEQTHLQYRLPVRVHVYVRHSARPRDRAKYLATSWPDGLFPRVHTVVQAVHGQTSVLADAEALLDASFNAHSYDEPLLCIDMGRAQTVDGSRFFEQPDSFAGLEQVVRFSGAEF